MVHVASRGDTRHAMQEGRLRAPVVTSDTTLGSHCLSPLPANYMLPEEATTLLCCKRAPMVECDLCGTS